MIAFFPIYPTGKFSPVAEYDWCCTFHLRTDSNSGQIILAEDSLKIIINNRVREH